VTALHIIQCRRIGELLFYVLLMVYSLLKHNSLFLPTTT
jgi:hypothetical protein